VMAFASRKYRPPNPNSLSYKYGRILRRAIQKNPFLLFGVPFIGTIVAGSFFLSSATSLRYERRDEKVKQVSKEDALGLDRNRRKVNLRDEYYRLQMGESVDIDNWEQKRVERLPGESENIL